MTLSILRALVLFAFVTSVTPGPNNMMLMASGANFGFRRTLPHMLGVSIGFGAMAFVLGIFVVGLFLAEPRAVLLLSVVSVVYMLWLAWKIAHAAAPGEKSVGSRPISFVQAALFQWVNPKAWAMALSAVSLYAPDRTTQDVAVVALIFSLVNLPSVSLWVAIGQQIRRVLTNPSRLHAFNWTMAVLLVLSLVPMLGEFATF